IVTNGTFTNAKIRYAGLMQATLTGSSGGAGTSSGSVCPSLINSTFGFSLKVPQTITHEKALLNCQAELSAFLDAARLLGRKLLCCVWQFGYFNQRTFEDFGAFQERLEPFLAEWPRDVPVAVEIRNKQWMGPQFVDCLHRHQAVCVLADQAWVPPPLTLVKKLDPITGSFGYVRLLGDRAEVDKRTSKLDHIAIDRSEQIRSDAQAIRLLAQRVPVLAFVNSHFAGYAPGTIQQLLEALKHDTEAETP